MTVILFKLLGAAVFGLLMLWGMLINSRVVCPYCERGKSFKRSEHEALGDGYYLANCDDCKKDFGFHRRNDNV